ncbi:MAG: CDP-glycerol glycerophosphotransferase family protein [Mogibacterium sp.]|nr:CDP-glycerol glycerophosphotransferase family protein [Mogibacterium sp.]
MSDIKYKISVITPIYNAERFLYEAIESVITQSMGFDDIQLILVDDGSPDSSADICMRYAAAHPDNIIYVKKENGGVSSARNAGINYVSGKYIIFMDSDDRWDCEAFLRIYEFFEAHPGKFDVCSCRIKFFGDYEGREHPLNYKFTNGARVADLIEEPEIISSTIGSVAVRASAVGELRFNEKISAGEDSLFVNSLLLEKPCLGILPDALFYYRRNMNQSSGSSSATRKVSWYTIVPDQYYLGLCGRSIEKHGEVLPFIQYVIMYDLRWRKYDPYMMTVLSDDEREQHLRILREVLSHIDNKVIRKAEGFNQYRRLYLFELKHGSGLPARAELKEGVLRYRKTRIFNFTVSNVARVTVFEFENGGLTIEGVCGIKGLAQDYELAAKDDKGNLYPAVMEPYEKRDVRGFAGEYVIHGESFRITMPIRSGMTVKLALMIRDEEITLNPFFDDYLRIRNMAKTGTADYCFREGYIIRNIAGELTIVKDNVVNRLKAEQAWKRSVNNAENPETEAQHRYEIELGKIMRSAKAGNQVVFISGRADDVLCDNMQHVYDRISLPKTFYSKTGIYRDPEMYRKAAELVCSAKVIVTDDYLPVLPNYHKQAGQHIVQLWHATGAYKHFGKDSGSIHPAKDRLYHKDYDLVTVSSEGIRQIYADCFRIPVERVRATGVARTDDLFDIRLKEKALERIYIKHPEFRDKEIILYAPTFRDVPGRGRSHFSPQMDFRVLSEAIGKDRVFVLCPHPVMTEPIITEHYDNVVEIRDVSTSDMMYAGSTLVTDYSSVIFEFALMGKPILFYCYDYDTYERDFYLDMEHELPGPLLKTQEELMHYLKGQVINFEDNYSRFCEKYAGACDGHSTERICDLINDLYHDIDPQDRR